MGRHSKPSRTLRNLRAVTVAAAAASPVILAVPASASTLDAIEHCESGGDPTAQNPHSTASGAFQFLDSTWNNYGGYARAKDAPYSVQLQKARQTPLSAWNASKHCWGGKSGPVSSHAATPKVEHKAAPKHRLEGTTPPKPTRHLAKVHAPVHHYPTSGSVYHVVSGDTLSDIAEDHGTSWPRLYDANRSVVGGDPNLIFPGQELRMP